MRQWVVLDNEGQKIFGVLHKPDKNITKCPAVVFCHGFAGNKCGRYRLYVKLADKLAQAGIFVLRIDYRGHGDSEGELYETTIDNMVSDANKALEYLSIHPQVNSEKLALMGRSLGGPIALKVAVKSTQIKSIVLWTPLYNGEPWKEDYEKRMKKRRFISWFFKGPVSFHGHLVSIDFVKQFFDINPESELEKLQDIPLLHVHSEKDSVIESFHKERYQECRKKAKALTKFISLPNSNHEISDPKDQETIIKETLKWFKETLK